MREKARIRRICSLLQKVWEEYPNLRLGQLLEGKIANDCCIFHIEDAEWEKQFQAQYDFVLTSKIVEDEIVNEEEYKPKGGFIP
jgi:hypothetical protein